MDFFARSGKYFLVIAYFLVFSFVVVTYGQAGAQCTGSGCGGVGGTSTCDAGYACFLGHCNASPQNCATSSGQSCTGSGCGGVSSSCPSGYACLGGHCNLSNNCSSNSQPSTCNSAGGPCQPCCKPGLTCSHDNGSRCLPPQELSCSGNGCDVSVCGYGYRCQDSHCVVDATCTADTLDVAYSGPKITSFSGLMARVYNLLFPAAVLYGSIMIIKAGYILMTSQGNPQQTRVGQEDLTAAILGTAFVVLSAAILRIIIVQILGGSVSF